MSSDLRSQLQSTLSGSYTLERELGGGGMSRVFVADETRLGRKVVVKVLSPELAAGISAERFEREIKLAASLQQANIVPVLSAGDSAGLPYYTMPLVDGESLRARLARGPLSIVEVTSILRDVSRALAYAHERGIVHRDIKPDNVLLSRGTAVVTDFGIAKALAAAQTHAPGATLTQIGTALGTPAYMAPEQAAGDPSTDHRADFYAFGCMAYELLTGRPPFDARTPQKLLAAHMGQTARPVSELRPDTPPELTSLVARCMAKDADERPQTADELLAVLEATPTSDTQQSAMPAILLGGRGMLKKALGLYAAAFIIVAVVAKAAIVGIGLPDWVLPGALVVMALGLPAILFTAYTQYVARRALTTSPTLTPGGTPRAPRHGTMATVAIKASPHLSWRRTALGGAYAIGAFILAIGAFMLLRALGIGPAGSLLAAGKLKASEPLLVADFRVGGADSALGGVITEALRTDLGQSSAISVVPTSVVSAALRRMQRPADSRLDLSLAREIAQREGIRAIVHGDVTPLAGGFVLTVRLVAAETGDELASFRETVDGPKELLPTLDRLTRALRGKIGESIKTVRATAPLEQVTTPSLDALKKFVDGTRAGDYEGDYARGAELLKQAIALDTAFAMAYRKLAVMLGNIGVAPAERDSAVARAYRYRDRLTERERLYATAYYFAGGPGRDRGKGVAAYEEVLAKFPDDRITLNNLALLLQSRRDYARAEALLRQGVAIRGGINHATNLVSVLVDEGKFAAADSALANAKREFSKSPAVVGLEVPLILHSNGIDSAARVLDAARSHADPYVRSSAVRTLAAIALARGRLSEAMSLRASAGAIDSARGAYAPALYDSVTAAWIDAWFRGNNARAIQTLDAAVARTPLRTVSAADQIYFRTASVYAMGGRPDKARAILTQYRADLRDTAELREEQPAAHVPLAEIALAEKRPLDAVKEFRLSDTAPDGPAHGCRQCTYVALGRAFDLAEMPDSAIAYFERYLETPFSARFVSFNALSIGVDGENLAGTYKRLGELYEAKGDRPKATSYYTKFVDLWKNADADLQPKVAEVKKRLARLSDTEKR